MIFLNNKVYDILKIIALIILPLSELIASLASIWGFTYGQQIVASLVAIDVFMGTVIKIASDSYSQLDEEEEEDNKKGE